MSDILFPAGLIVDRPDLTIEMMQHYAKMWNVDHTLLGEGVFNGSLLGVHTPRIQLGISHYSQGVMSIGDFPGGCVLLHYTLNEITNDPLYNFHNRPILPHEVVMLTPGDGYDRVTYGDNHIITIAIKEDLFYKEFYAFFAETDSIKNKRFYLKLDKISYFQKIIVSWISYLINEFPKLTIKPEYDRMESEILRQIFDCMLPVTLVKKRKKFQSKIVRDLLNEHKYEPIDISSILNELNISESQLHHVFKKEYGITPKRYLHLLRLNAIRKELLLADPNSITISEVAYQYNFFQMSHFSAQYKNIFGETPSQTLHHHK
jgi:AraC-like DNA-binding protein